MTQPFRPQPKRSEVLRREIDGQTEVPVPGARPDRGSCPSCGVPETAWCAEQCTLDDPNYVGAVVDLARCSHCVRRWAWLEKAGELEHSGLPKDPADAKVIAIPGSHVKHAALGGHAVCGRARTVYTAVQLDDGEKW
jgi:hypothetical protein